MKVLAQHLDQFVEYAQLRGIPIEGLSEGIKYSPVDRSDSLATIAEADFYRVIDSLAAQTKDELLGIRVGEFLNLNTLGVVYTISQKTTSLREALFYCQSWLKNTLPILEIENTITEEYASIALRSKTSSDEATGKHSAGSSISANRNISADGNISADKIILETCLTVMAREIRVLSGKPVQITLCSPCYRSHYPSGWQEGERFEIVFDLPVLKATLQDYYRWGLDLLLPAYVHLIETMKSENTFTNKVSRMTLKLATPRLPDLKTVAGTFHLTTRSFQRRLAAEGITFRQITDKLHFQICELLLRHDRFSTTDMACILGYSQPAAFLHAFKKWYSD